jgi:hypothetical protein
MAHRVNISVSVPDDLYEDVVLPAKNNHVLAELVCSCLELYSKSTPVKEYVDTGAQAKADSEWDDVLASLNSAVGALDSDVSFLGDNLEEGKSKVAESAGEGSGAGGSTGIDGASSQELRKVAEKVDSLEDGFGSLKSMLEDVLGYVKGMSEGGKSGKGAVANQAAGKSFEVEDDSVEAVPAEDHHGGESQVSGYSVVQDLKPGSVNTRNYDTEEEPKTENSNPVRTNPETASLIDEMADSLGADMFI